MNLHGKSSNFKVNQNGMIALFRVDQWCGAIWVFP